MNKFASFASRAALVALAMSAGAAQAALSTDVTTALDGAKADGVALGAAVLVVVIAIAAFKMLRRAI